MTKRSKAELSAENRILRNAKTAEGIVAVANNFLKWGGIVLIFYFLDHSIAALAGKNTSSDIAVSLITDFKINKYLGYAIGGGGALYGYGQKELRRKTIERLHGQIKILEEKLDPRRSSSKLTKSGDTRPEDM